METIGAVDSKATVMVGIARDGLGNLGAVQLHMFVQVGKNTTTERDLLGALTDLVSARIKGSGDLVGRLGALISELAESDEGEKVPGGEV